MTAEPQPAPTPVPPPAAAPQTKPQPDPPTTPTKGKVFSFNVLLHSEIAQGNHSGQQVFVISDTPEDARTDIVNYFTTDLASLEGPTLNNEPFVLASGKKLASASTASKGATS